MAVIDHYIRNLVHHDASEVELVSDQPARFVLDHGERQSRKPISHRELSALVHETAPEASVESLMMTGRASFVRNCAGVDVLVMVDAVRPSAWSVQLLPQGTVRSSEAEAVDTPISLVPPAAGGDDGGVEPTEPAGLDPRGLTAEAAAVSRTLPPMPGRRSITARQVAVEKGEPRVNGLLRTMAELGASDLHLSSGVVPMLRLHGEMQDIEERDPLTDDDIRTMIGEIAPTNLVDDYRRSGDADFAHTVEGVARFRINAFVDRNGAGLVARRIPFDILTADQIGLPRPVLDLCMLSKGLVVVTGPTGSGKSTTLATLVDHINQTRADHVVTIEDPIEFVHENKRCLLNQREVGTHTESFATALRAALREDPDVVLVGEMRDLETVAIALETAETGHLVFGTLHTSSAIGTIDRIIDQFPAGQQAQVRAMLSESLRGVIAQTLCRKKGGGRVGAYEVLISTPAVSNLIREGKTFQLGSVIQTGRKLGMQTLNQHLLGLVLENQVEPDEAYIKATDKLGLKQLFAQKNVPLDLAPGTTPR